MGCGSRLFKSLQGETGKQVVKRMFHQNRCAKVQSGGSEVGSLLTWLLCFQWGLEAGPHRRGWQTCLPCL
jgi:hypothetical protein